MSTDLLAGSYPRGNTLVTPGTYYCARCGIRIPSGVSHSCAGYISPSNPQEVAPILDDWLYRAGYEQGRRDAERDRDLSPMGRKETP